MNRRIPELDGLRGVAIGLVLLYHYFYLTWNTPYVRCFALGWTGVDLFFVLSGFLIGGILLDARSAVNYFRVFYTRRFFRIVPLYLAVIVTFTALTYFLQRHYSQSFLDLGSGKSLPWWCYLTFTQNFAMASTERFGLAALAVTWSLAVEEQFYLVLPLIIRYVSRMRLITVLKIGIYTAPLLRIALMIMFPHNWLAPWALMPCRADALLLGVLAAIALRDPAWEQKLRKANLGAIFGVLAVGMVGFTIFTPGVDNPVMQSLGYTWTALFYVCALVYALTRPAGWLSRGLRLAGLRWLGGLAYGVYLIHETVLDVLFGALRHHEPNITDGSALLLSIAALAITFIVAQASWKFFELPLIQRHRDEYRTEGAQ
ncbi:MAG: acyltransferase family protein [Candidatus Acidiferrum sp.]